MTLTLLLDLDDTLLDNNVDVFLPAYLQSFSEFISPIVDKNKFLKAVLDGTQLMIDNQLPDCTLLEIFQSSFYPSTGIEQDRFEVVAQEFYEQLYPDLRKYTKPIPGVVQTVKQALDRGYRIVIATNPLFPRTAILQRLAWAGLSVDEFDFDIIASFETLHFAKPNPAYYAELLGRLGWPEGRVLVVGDDLERDIDAAGKMGIGSYWINFRSQDQSVQFNSPTGEGKISDLLSWINETTDDQLIPDFRSTTAMISILRSTPAVLDSICRRLPEDRWNDRFEPGEWCATEIIGHLRDVENEVNLPRIEKVLEEQNPFLPGEDTDAWADERGYVNQDGMNALRSFTAARMELIALLTSIPATFWDRPAQHSIFGKTDVAEIVRIITGHDQMHIRQILQILNG